MPLYEFRCTYCDNLFEQIQPHTADYPVCSVCGSETMRIMSSSNVKFKGSGFHSTDYTKHGRVRHHHVNKT